MEQKEYEAEDFVSGAFLDLEVVDEFGNPLPNKSLILILSDGSERRIETDEYGYSSVYIPEGEIEIRLSDGEEFYTLSIESENVLGLIETGETSSEGGGTNA